MRKRSRLFANILCAALVALGLGACANTAKEEKDLTAPSSVEELKAKAGPGQVGLSWTEPADGDFASVSIGFTPAVDAVTQPISVAKGTTSYAVTELANGTEYSFTVAALDTAGNAATAAAISATPTVTLYLVGDSTVCGFDDTTYYYPRYGYGTKIANYLDSSVTVSNLALSGRSSLSYLIEDDYKALCDSIQAGDYLMIGFGHNDEKAEVARYTNPNTDVTDPGSFKYCLYTNYIKMAQDKGAIPILCTPIVRRSASNDYSGNAGHIVTSSLAAYPGGDYPQCIRDLGSALGVAVIDNTALTKELYTAAYAAAGGSDGTLYYHAWTNSKAGSVDNTHLNEYGAATVAYLMANALSSSSCSLKDYVKADITQPQQSMLTVNPSYVQASYYPPTNMSTIWSTTDPWWGTVFGDCGGASKINTTYYGIAETASGVSMRSGTLGASGTTNDGSACGKIAASTDGLAMYFQAIAADADFTITAKATIVAITSNAQVSFGIMLRDDMYIDTFDASITSNYIACGPLKITTAAAGTMYSSFGRVTDSSAVMTVPYTYAASLVAPVAGDAIPLSMTKVGSEITVKYGAEAEARYTIDLSAKDSAYNYVGLFTARQCIVDFSEIALTIN